VAAIPVNAMVANMTQQRIRAARASFHKSFLKKVLNKTSIKSVTKPI
jgi:hypothetical protein